MKKNQLPTLQDIEALTASLPRSYAKGFTPIKSWGGGERQKDGSFTMHYPIYNRVTEEFFCLVSSRGWLDYEYNPEQAGKY
jgi:hypothetical protein